MLTLTLRFLKVSVWLAVIMQLAAIASFAQLSSRPNVVLFGADGMRQDLLVKYAKERLITSIPLNFISSASGNGMMTEAPATTGAGWFSLSTGSWSGVHGVTNDVFHINRQPFTSRVAAFDAGVLQSETLAQAAERGGRKVAQIEWAGGLNGRIKGPTVDGRTIHSGRGVTTNYVSSADGASEISSFGIQFDHPAGFAGQAPFAAAAPSPATGWANVPASYSPAMEMEMRVLDAGVNKYGQYAYIYDTTNDGVTNYNKVLFSPTKDGAVSAGTLSQGNWTDVKVTINGGALAGLTAGYLIKVETLAPDLSQVRFFHTFVARAVASWPDWAGSSGFTGDFAEYIAQKFPSATNADPALLISGVVSEDTFVEQGLYWEKCYQPLARYIIVNYQPDLLMQGYLLTEDVQNAFLGLITPTLVGAIPNPAYAPGARLTIRENFIRRAYRGAVETMVFSRILMGLDATTFLTSDHGAAPQFLAIDASKVLVNLGLLSKPQTQNCRVAIGETIGKAMACWTGGTVQIYLNLAGRDPVNTGLQQVAAVDAESTVNQIKAAFQGLSDPNDWTGDGNPEGWKLIDKAYTKAEARYIPNGAGSTSDMAHPSRTGDLVVFAFPPYQFERPTPGTPVARSGYFGEQGYSPDLVHLGANINMRGTLIGFGLGVKNGASTSARTIDVAPTIAFLLDIPQPQYSQGRPLLEILTGGNLFTRLSLIGLSDYHGQLDPANLAFDGVPSAVGGASTLATLFPEENDLTGTQALLVSSGDNIGASPANSSLLEDKPAIDVLNALGADASTFGTHEFDRGIQKLRERLVQAQFPFLAVNIVDAQTGIRPSWIQPSVVYQVGGAKVGIIGAAKENTPAFVAQTKIAGLQFLPAAERIRAESERLRKLGVKIQVVLLHEGSLNGSNAQDGTEAVPWTGPAIDIAQALQNTTVDVIFAGHTHRGTNARVGHILVAQGMNAGMSYSVVQLALFGGDVWWAGGATRIAKSLGVPLRADVQATVDMANAQTAVLRNQVIGMQAFDIKRDPTRLNESAMGNMIADSMRARYPGVDAAYTNSGGLRADLNCAPPSAGENNCEITWGEAFSVLPFGNRTVIETLTYEQLLQAFVNGFTPACDPTFSGGTGRFPQISGLSAQYSCSGTVPVVNSIYLGSALLKSGDTIRLVTNDFLFTGGDGYTTLSAGTDVLNTDDDLLNIAVDYIGQNSPVSPVVEGRIVRIP
jgi:2',3'-cyclic-nucleotide 2'-phosphodiesterase (5'-nucleotidase family)